jgi:small GTP-binding protein
LAIGGLGGELIVYDTKTSTKYSLKERGQIYDFDWSSDGKYLAVAYGYNDNKVVIFNPEDNARLSILEGHTHGVGSVSFSFDGQLLASKSTDNTIMIWRSHDWSVIGSFPELHHQDIWMGGIAFNPKFPVLATLGQSNSVIRIWNIDHNVLLGTKPVTESVRYTTAKIVIVGDAGVGKTGLGWRLAHDEFREHASTHGQQFWIVPALGIKRRDGADCEAVLWDLAGQHIYRSIHSIFLDNVDASLVLFDPSNRQDPIKGAHFWLQQLKGRTQLPPTVLVGARVDRGAPVLSQQELNQFCQRFGIRGGYVSTSARTGEGLHSLLEVLKAQIPWDQMTATVTTATFKQIKDFVLRLKEEPEHTRVLLRPKELRARLQAADKDCQFSDAELITAVRHLETHGYVTVLQSSSGEEHILLMPDLLVDLASSIVLLADKNPHELGAVIETKLLQGEYPLDELKHLVKLEQRIMLDAAVLRFLEHSICFRETLGNDTVLIFPGLIKQKRPLEDDFETVEGVSYIVRGRVENVFAALVVLLAYTPMFTRINQWQYQAQYEMNIGEIHGFRLIEEREGELEFVLYYGSTTPTYGRSLFQGLFESFLYRRDVEVTRYAPVLCPGGHQQQRATVMNMLREGSDSMFCARCGKEIHLPEIEKPDALGRRASEEIRVSEASARLRNSYETYLTRIKGFRRDRAAPHCYISYPEDCAEWVSVLAHDLRHAGVVVVAGREQIRANDFILQVYTPNILRALEESADYGDKDGEMVHSQGIGNKPAVIPILRSGGLRGAIPSGLRRLRYGDFRDETAYAVALFDLVLTLYAVPLNHEAFKPLRLSLQQQWQRTLNRVVQRGAYEAESGATEMHGPGQNLAEGNEMDERYIDFDLTIGPGGHAIADSEEGQAVADISVEVPKDIVLSLKLIEKGQTDADLLRQVGQAFYNWLFPGPIHTHFHQTETRARLEKAKLRLRMRIEPRGITSLPLELIYRTEGGYFLGANPGTVLSRYLNLPLPPQRARNREGTLHLLAIIADPTDQVRLPPEEWEATICQALENPLVSGQITLQTVKRATRKEIRNALLTQKPDIIQFVGHGIYQNGKGHLALVDEDTNKTWLVDDESFANLYMGYDDHLGLISLATCESAKSDDPQSFLGIAPRLVQRGIPAVIAMQYPVLIRTAKIFLEDFYTSVAARKPLDWAVQSARNAISLDAGLGNREFATPVLYMRAKDGRVF